MLHRSATGRIESIKREPKETEPTFIAPSEASVYTSLSEKKNVGNRTRNTAMDNSTCIVTRTDQPSNVGLVRTAASAFC
jgi:hypothetical protein